ncbi:MAG: energy-coupling factor transporter ATPase [Firmicutes bacterium]|nr:energy-coupling factor transporter ATPase [Bacillota bacterium]
MSIEVSNLTHIYSPGQPEEQTALDGISFTVEDGSFVGIIGHTGSGKSTLVQHLNGILRPTRGKIYVDGEDITQKNVSLTDIRKKVGLVFQYPEYQLFEETVAKDVAFGPKNLGLPEQQIDMRVRNAIELVGLDYEEIKDVSPFELSGGQKRRVAIAGVIAMQPGVLILDEPTAGLDPKSHDDILKMIDGMRASQQMTTILVSHNMDDVAKMADKVLVIDEGRLAMEGTPQEVFSKGEELTALGLDLPAVTHILMKLKENGIDAGTDTFDVKEAAAAIAAALEGGVEAESSAGQEE